MTAKILGMPLQALGRWVRLSDKGQLKGVGDKPVSAEQMELTFYNYERLHSTLGYVSPMTFVRRWLVAQQ